MTRSGFPTASRQENLDLAGRDRTQANAKGTPPAAQPDRSAGILCYQPAGIGTAKRRSIPSRRNRGAPAAGRPGQDL